MVYSQRLVMCVLVDGIVQKELANGQVNLPFGSEYVLRFRNKNDRRAVVQIYLDGENVSGNGYIIPANDHVDIRRHHDRDAAFKLVALDSPEAFDAGKNGANEDKQKGVIEARFYLEKKEPPRPIHIHHHHDHYQPPVVIDHHHHHPYYPKPDPYPWHTPYYTCSGDTKGGGATYRNSMLRTCSVGGSSVRGMYEDSPAATLGFADTYADRSSTLQDGCTVEGGSTGQRFTSMHIELETECTVLKLFLQGYRKEAETVAVEEPHHKLRETAKERSLRELEEENRRLKEELYRSSKERQLSEENARLREELAKKCSQS